MNLSELTGILEELAKTEPSAAGNRRLHEVLTLACNDAVKNEPTGFGNLFSQVEFLCKRHHLKMADRVSVQQMRRRTNSSEVPDTEQWLSDIHVLSSFIDVLKGQPSAFHSSEEHLQGKKLQGSIRCIVQQWNKQFIHVTTTDGEQLISYGEGDDGLDQSYLNDLLHEGIQLNVLEARATEKEGKPCLRGLIVVEPDFLIDISALAALFTDYGHHPLLYTVSRLKQRANSQAILLGNFAGAALDDIINRTDFSFGQTLMESFREQALQFCTCPDFSPITFKADAAEQVKNLQEVVKVILGTTEKREKAILEPSFVCEALGLQGRVDLMTTDLGLLVELGRRKQLWTIIWLKNI